MSSPKTLPLWLIDLDNTIFDASESMFSAIHDAMNHFIMERLNMTHDEACALRAQYWRHYGATYEGMWKHHRIHPNEFLKATHSFDLLAHVKKEGDPAAVIGALPGRKVLYTNSPRHYAETILNYLDLQNSFDRLYTSTDSFYAGRWHAKPSEVVLRDIMRTFHVKPSECILVDDSLFNLQTAHQLGIRTVWVTGFRRAHGHGGEPYSLPYVTWRVNELKDLLRLQGVVPAKKPEPLKRNRFLIQ